MEYYSFKEALANPKEVICLDLSGNYLTGLPVEIGQLTKLRELSLFNNYLTSLPSEIGKLTNLRKLILTELRKRDSVDKRDSYSG